MPNCLWKFLARISSTFNMSKWDLQLFLGLPTKQDWPQLLIECFAEIFGTFIIIFFGCGSVLSPAVQVSFQQFFMFMEKTKKNFSKDNDINKNIVDIVQISLAFGLAVFVGVHLAGPVSGGYLNPALALGSLVAGQIGLFRVLLFIISQLIGAIGKKLKKKFKNLFFLNFKFFSWRGNFVPNHSGFLCTISSTWF